MIVRTAVAAGITILVGASGAAAQSCTGANAPTYEDLRPLFIATGAAVDTLRLKGTAELTVVANASWEIVDWSFGRPTAPSLASATAVCRIAALWSSRGDSIAVTWLAAPDVRESEPMSGVTESREIEDDHMARRPTFEGAVLRTRSALDSLIAQSFSEAGGETGTGLTSLFILVDESGRTESVRIFQSSGVRALDEAALRVLMPQEWTSAVYAGFPVARWMISAIDWAPN